MYQKVINNSLEGLVIALLVLVIGTLVWFKFHTPYHAPFFPQEIKQVQDTYHFTMVDGEPVDPATGRQAPLRSK